MMSDRIRKIKPCPFCGGDGHIRMLDGHFYVDADHTRTCAIKPSTFLLNSKVLRYHLKKWNRRPEENK